jgi:hypothetical protein
MTKWICKGCNKKCEVNIHPGWCPSYCLIFPYPTVTNPYEIKWEQDCTTEEKIQLSTPERIRAESIADLCRFYLDMDKRLTRVEEKMPTTWVMWSDRVEELEKKVQELEQMLQNHIHYIAGTTGKPARREK